MKYLDISQKGRISMLCCCVSLLYSSFTSSHLGYYGISWSVVSSGGPDPPTIKSTMTHVWPQNDDKSFWLLASRLSDEDTAHRVIDGPAVDESSVLLEPLNTFGVHISEWEHLQVCVMMWLNQHAAGSVVEEPPASVCWRVEHREVCGLLRLLKQASTVCSTSGPTSALFSGHSSRSGSGPQPRCLQPAAVHLLLRVGYRPGKFSA